MRETHYLIVNILPLCQRSHVFNINLNRWISARDVSFSLYREHMSVQDYSLLCRVDMSVFFSFSVALAVLCITNDLIRLNVIWYSEDLLNEYKLAEWHGVTLYAGHESETWRQLAVCIAGVSADESFWKHAVHIIHELDCHAVGLHTFSLVMQVYAWPVRLLVLSNVVTATRHANNGDQTQAPAHERHLYCANCQADIVFGGRVTEAQKCLNCCT